MSDFQKVEAGIYVRGNRWCVEKSSVRRGCGEGEARVSRLTATLQSRHSRRSTVRLPQKPIFFFISWSIQTFRSHENAAASRKPVSAG